MYQTRRNVLKLVVAAAGMASAGVRLAGGQGGQDAPQRNPSRTAPNGDSIIDPNLDPKRAKAVLEENQKDMKKNIERLFQLATELKEEVEKTDSTTTLSLVMLRKTEEIEKLARMIRDRAKG
jgi:hypothetical protein